ncbi:P1 family peptidase [Nocardioides sp. Kera G14]|uniref:DmpA family aminopeptidase n=1 Tax=Nocardioides sp. Kera G14 TaxID=2884264 RepID=UPI001D12E852|nr:P1 family peptidase [Nocardioides sp. Kera G14]UDY25228.1 P1 family peptidase [Nocardioides sp. Kera G14]
MKARARDLGIPFPGSPGPLNAITDVPGLEIGYTTLTGDDPRVNTGVTAILPFGRAGVGTTAVAGFHNQNGNGEMTGVSWIQETGALNLPVLITNTHSVGPCHEGVIGWVGDHVPSLTTAWLLPVVGETWDGYLNDIFGNHVTATHARDAIDSARGGVIPEEGNVGGGTAMNCYGFKGGSGTSSRLVSHAGDEYVVAAFVQANFGSRHELTIAGRAVGREIDAPNPMEDGDPSWLIPPGAGSIIVVIATNAPLLPGQCQALARRAPMGIARTGTTGSHFSGDLVLALSTGNPDALASRMPLIPQPDYRELRLIPWGFMDPFYEAAAHAVEEAIVNALVAAEDMTGRDSHQSVKLPHDQLAALFA